MEQKTKLAAPQAIEDEKAREEELMVCSKAFNAETSRLEDEDGPCRTAEN